MKKQKINFNTSELDLKPLPHSEQIEKKVLAYLVKYPELISASSKFINMPGFFYKDWHVEIWDQVKVMMDKNLQVGVETLSEHFRVIGQPEVSIYIKTFALLAEWHIPTHKFLPYMLKISEYAIARMLHRLGHHINQEALKPGKDPLELLGESSEGLDVIYQHLASLKEVTMQDAVQNLYKSMQEAAKSTDGMLGIPSSLQGLNQRIKGYRRGNLIVLGATTGEGKTTLAWQEAIHMASTGNPIGYISLEMSMEELITMSVVEATSIPAGDVIELKVTSDQQRLIGSRITQVANLPISFVDRPGLKIGEIKASARLWRKNNGIKALFVDHLHLAYDDVDHGTSTEQRFTNVANKLKELAKELDIPVIALAQLNRKEKSEKIRRHAISDLKYAGGIEQAADVVLLIHRPILHGILTDAMGNSTEGQAVIIVGKLRLMEKKDVLCRFTGTAFRDIEEAPYKPSAGIQKLPPAPF